MGEAEVIRNTHRGPLTTEALLQDLNRLGVEPGMTLLVHSSLSSLGWVCGGPVAVVLALERAIRPFGCLVMPTHSGELSDPASWVNPPVPEGWHDAIRRSMPPFDPDMTPSRGMGAIPECFRTQREVLRSAHPQVSFAAWGEAALKIVGEHSLDHSLGEGSPLARVYELDGRVLLLGVEHDRNTSLHLAEYRAQVPKKRVVERYAPLSVEGHRKWMKFEDINYDSSDFAALGRDFCRVEKKRIRFGRVGNARCQLFPQRLCVDFAVRWLERHRR